MGWGALTGPLVGLASATPRQPQLGGAAAGVGLLLNRLGHQGSPGDPLEPFIGQKGLLHHPVFEGMETDDGQHPAR